MNIHGGDIYSFAEKNGKLPLDYSANINPYGLPEGIVQAVTASIAMCCHYPDVHCTALKKAIGQWESVPQDYLLFGNGAADIIFRLAQSLRPKSALVLSPTFHEYEAALTSVQCPISYYALSPHDNFMLHPNIQNMLPQNGIVFLCNPNNPTGTLISKALMAQIAHICGQQNTVLVVDECFMDFIEDKEQFSAKELLAENAHLLILKAFTKLFAMPGLRLGYCLCANKTLLAQLATTAQPWSVSVPAQAAGVAACMERDFVTQTVLQIQRERRFLIHALKDLGMRVFPGEANFILFRVPIGQQGLQPFLQQHGILIRCCANYHGLDESYYRIAIKQHSENLTLLKGIRLWLNQL